jgi:hypothetical protein
MRESFGDGSDDSMTDSEFAFRELVLAAPTLSVTQAARAAITVIRGRCAAGVVRPGLMCASRAGRIA